jgi:hypothetical protein
MQVPLPDTGYEARAGQHMAAAGRNPHHDVFMIPEDIHIRSQTC